MNRNVWMDPLTLHLGTLTAWTDHAVTELSWAELLSAAHWGSQSKKGTGAWFAHKSLGEHRANSGGANANSQEALEVTMERWVFGEAGLSPTNGKKWFPKGYKATTQNRCAEKQRKWFCESNSLDPVHSKQSPRPPDLKDMTAWLFPNHNKKQIYPKLVVRPPSLTNVLKNAQLCCVCLDSLPHTQSEFSHNWSLSQLQAFETGSARPSVRSTPYCSGPPALCRCQTPVKSNATVGVPCCSAIASRYLRAETTSQTDKDQEHMVEGKAYPPKSTQEDLKSFPCT